jgi:hypothetical protein
MFKIVPTRNCNAGVLVWTLVCLASATASGCKSTTPSPEQTTERTTEKSTEKLRQTISKEVGEPGRREQMLRLVDQIDIAEGNFNKDVSAFVTTYESVNADYDAPRATFDHLFSDFDADRTRARTQILDLHFKLTSLATDKEWGPIADAEMKMYEASEQARTAEEEMK